MHMKRSRFRLNPIVIPALPLFLLVSFFVYASVFDVWDRKTTELPLIHQFGMLTLALLLISSPKLMSLLSKYVKETKRGKQPHRLRPDPNVFGNRSHILKAALQAMLLLWPFVFAGFLYSRYHVGKLNDVSDACLVLLYSTIHIFGVVVMIGPTVMFSLMIDGDCVAHRFLGRFTLSKLPIRDLASIRMNGRLIPLLLRFHDGSSIRFWAGMQQAEINRFCETILQRVDVPIVDCTAVS